MKDLVFLQDEQAITTSLKVAEVFEKNHQHVMRDIRDLEKQIKDVSKNGQMFFEDKYLDNYGRLQPMYLMNRDGFTLLAMGFTGKKALKFKLAYIDAFNKMEQKLIQLLAERKSAEWLEVHKLSKVELRNLTNLIKEKLIPLMIQEGASQGAIRYVYKNYVDMIQKLLGIKKGTRDELPIDLLYELGKVEQMAMVIIKGLIAGDTCSKQIYADTKTKINDYAQISLFSQRFLKGE